MREYETIYILRPEMGGDAVDAFNQRMKDIISASAGKVIRLSNWGKKKLAYRVKKCTRGIYVHILYVAEGKAVMELERNLRLSEHAIRYLSVLLNPDVDVEARQVEADVKLRGDAEDDLPVAALAAAPGVATPVSVTAPLAAEAAEAPDADAADEADQQA